MAAGLVLGGCHRHARQPTTTSITLPGFVTGANSAGFTILVGRSGGVDCASLRPHDTTNSSSYIGYECPNPPGDLDVQHTVAHDGKHLLWGLLSPKVSRVVVRGADGKVAKAKVVLSGGLGSYVLEFTKLPSGFTVVGLDASGRTIATVTSDHIAPPIDVRNPSFSTL